jgi:hypothetical protein
LVESQREVSRFTSPVQKRCRVLGTVSLRVELSWVELSWVWALATSSGWRSCVEKETQKVRKVRREVSSELAVRVTRRRQSSGVQWRSGGLNKPASRFCLLTGSGEMTLPMQTDCTLF